ncbi:MAG: hypothetical protein FWD66_09900 [Paludibacter sp.]|nr:hypothetical protein [Paludibacter sp.]
MQPLREKRTNNNDKIQNLFFKLNHSCFEPRIDITDAFFFYNHFKLLDNPKNFKQFVDLYISMILIESKSNRLILSEINKANKFIKDDLMSLLFTNDKINKLNNLINFRPHFENIQISNPIIETKDGIVDYNIEMNNDDGQYCIVYPNIELNYNALYIDGIIHYSDKGEILIQEMYNCVISISKPIKANYINGKVHYYLDEPLIILTDIPYVHPYELIIYNLFMKIFNNGLLKGCVEFVYHNELTTFLIDVKTSQLELTSKGKLMLQKMNNQIYLTDDKNEITKLYMQMLIEAKERIGL